MRLARGERPLTAQLSIRLSSAHKSRLQRLFGYGLALMLGTAGSSSALELGEASVASALGQVLQVQIPYRLAANERLAPECVSLVRSLSAGDTLPTYADASRVTIGPSHIQILGSVRVREPLLGLNVRIRCDSVPHIVRSYQLFVDPPMPLAAASRAAIAATNNTAMQREAAPVAAPASDRGSRQSAAPPPEARTSQPTVSPRARGRTGESLVQGQAYRVVRGDTLSGIAARVADRPGTVWQTVEAIFAANAAAFTNGNVNRIEEGRSITIPVLTQSPTAALATAAAEVRRPVATEPTLPDPDSVPVTVAEPSASVSPQDATIDLAAPTAVVAPPPAEPERDDTTAERLTWMPSLLALGVGLVLLLSLAFVARRRRAPRVAQNVRDGLAETARVNAPPALVARAAEPDKRPATPTPPPEPWRISAGTGKATAAVHGTAISASTSETELGTPTLSAAAQIHAVDLDVGAPVTMTAGVDWFAGHSVASAGDDDTLDGATVRMTDGGGELADRASLTKTNRMPLPTDDDLTMTAVELELLRQDYEAEHTLTQQLSQELSNAVADLAATKAARAAAAAKGSSESEPVEPSDSTDDATAALPHAQR